MVSNEKPSSWGSKLSGHWLRKLRGKENAIQGVAYGFSHNHYYRVVNIRWPPIFREKNFSYSVDNRFEYRGPPGKRPFSIRRGYSL